MRLELGLSCGPQATLSKTSDSRSGPHIEIQHGRVLICICHGINCDRIASDGMVDGGMVGWDGGWWMGPLSGYCRRQEAAAHGLNGQFKCKLANALAEKARRRCEKQKQKQQLDNDNNNNKQKKFLCLLPVLFVASRGAAHTRPPGLHSLSQRRDRSLKWLDL